MKSKEIKIYLFKGFLSRIQPNIKEKEKSDRLSSRNQPDCDTVIQIHNNQYPIEPEKIE